MSTIASTYSPAAGAAARPAAASLAAHKDTQLLARLTGLFFLITYATSIPPYVSMYVPALSNPAFVLGGGFDQVVSWGAILELVLILANIASALTLYPVLKRRFPVLSLGFVTARLTESAFIAIGIVAVLALNTLRLHGVPTGADEAGLMAAGQALVAVHDWTFRLGPGVVVGVGNGLILGWMMWKTRLLPRALSILGLIGGPALLVAGGAVVLGVIEAGATWQAIATIPEFFWELGLGLWLLVRGFTPSAVTELERSGSASTAR
ncbi:DUF4386 domain-containing protein [Devosia sp.]|uniref:DUF4386 domain-containing protein n=1 Tax=Devosia sp. TaxID=1871048 RepID=UPI0035AF2C74